MGCHKLTYHPSQETIPFTGVWKGGSYEKIPINFREGLGKKGATEKKCDYYYPFGANISALSSTAPLSKPNSFKYNGNEEQLDFDLNLYDFNARMYDPVIGRFSSVDPMSDAPSQIDKTPYQFGWNNPVRYNDPSGECPCLAIPWIVAAIEAIATTSYSGYCWLCGL